MTYVEAWCYYFGPVCEWNKVLRDTSKLGVQSGRLPSVLKTKSMGWGKNMKADKLLRRHKVSQSGQDFKFNDKFQGRGNRDLGSWKRKEVSQVCTEDKQKEERDQRSRNVEWEQGRNTEVGALAPRGTPHLQSEATGHRHGPLHD